MSLKNEKASFGDMGIDFEEKAFYDILKAITHKFDFDYPPITKDEVFKEILEQAKKSKRYRLCWI
jgi:type I restriction enzyme R subunit